MSRSETLTGLLYKGKAAGLPSFPFCWRGNGPRSWRGMEEREGLELRRKDQSGGPERTGDRPQGGPAVRSAAARTLERFGLSSHRGRWIAAAVAILAVAVLLAVLFVASAWAATLTVNSTQDAADASPGDGACETVSGNGVCTLRAAMQESNALGGKDTLVIPGGSYLLSGAANEDAPPRAGTWILPTMRG